jgi:hypothetical protein
MEWKHGSTRIFQALAAVTCACLTEWTWEPTVPSGFCSPVIKVKRCGKAMVDEEKDLVSWWIFPIQLLEKAG